MAPVRQCPENFAPSHRFYPGASNRRAGMLRQEESRGRLISHLSSDSECIQLRFATFLGEDAVDDCAIEILRAIRLSATVAGLLLVELGSVQPIARKGRDRDL